MPLRAIIADKSLLAFELSRNDWRALQERLRADRSLGRLPCCDARAVAKTSHRGTQFFAHYAKNECVASPETEAHLAAKRAVYEGCIDAGWNAITEAVGPDGTWRADVLATQESRQVAFEIQLSHQSAERTRERQRGFASHHVRCCWLFRRLPFVVANRTVPAFEHVEPPDGSLPSVTVGARTFSLGEFARVMLGGQVKFCAKLTVRHDEVRCRIRRDRCRHCSATVHFVDATPPLLSSVCGLPMLEGNEFLAIQRMYVAWHRALESLYAEDLPLSAHAQATLPNLVLRSPPGKPFLTAAGRSGFCPECLEVVAFTEASHSLPVVMEIPLPVPAPDWPGTAFPHWCLEDSGSHCDIV